VQGTGVLSLPPTCDQTAPCPPHLSLEFESLDAATFQSAILGARESGTLLTSLIARLKPSNAPAWPPIEGRLQADTLVLGTFTLSNVSGDFRFHSAGADITSLDAGILGGSVHATGSVTAGDKPTYKLSASFEKLNPTQVMDLMEMKADGGSIDGTVQLELAGFTEKDLTSSAKGDLHFEWDHGTLASPSGDSVPPALNRFDRFTGDAAITDGALTMTKSEVKRGARKSSVEATITFAIPAQVQFGSPSEPRPANR
jgi:hypothetical protein